MLRACFLHGAHWTMKCYGATHAVYCIPAEMLVWPHKCGWQCAAGCAAYKEAWSPQCTGVFIVPVTCRFYTRDAFMLKFRQQTTSASMSCHRPKSRILALLSYWVVLHTAPYVFRTAVH